MNNKTIIAFKAIALACMPGCNKTERLMSDYPFVAIPPSAIEQLFNMGAINIAGEVSAQGDNEVRKLHEISITVKSVSDNAIVFSSWESIHGASNYTIDIFYTSSVAGSMVLIVQAL